MAVGVAWYATFRVERGIAPTTGDLHVREGWFWLVATDRAFGLTWVNAERAARPSLHANLNVTGLEGWAEPPVDPTIGEWRVGSIAVGWPMRMVGRQWAEIDRERLFVPHVAVDDDGFTIAKMAHNVAAPPVEGRLFVLWGGAVVNVLAFGVPTFAVLAPRLWRGRPTRPASAARAG